MENKYINEIRTTTTVPIYKKKQKTFEDHYMLTLFVGDESSIQGLCQEGHVHTAAKFGCQFTFYSLIASGSTDMCFSGPIPIITDQVDR